MGLRSSAPQGTQTHTPSLGTQCAQSARLQHTCTAPHHTDGAVAEVVGAVLHLLRVCIKVVAAHGHTCHQHTGARTCTRASAPASSRLSTPGACLTDCATIHTYTYQHQQHQHQQQWSNVWAALLRMHHTHAQPTAALCAGHLQLTHAHVRVQVCTPSMLTHPHTHTLPKVTLTKRMPLPSLRLHAGSKP